MQTPEITTRLMRPDDLDACMELRESVGWNQQRRDWELFLSFRPEGCFVAVAGSKVVGTVTTIDYDARFSWIGMVIVHPEFRRRGIGTALLERAIASLEACETIKLDATPAGKKVYDRLGFVDEYGLVRLTGTARISGAAPEDADPGITPLTSEHLPVVAEFDAPIFGADRHRVLAAWRERAPRYARILLRDNRVRGYCMGRPGRNYETIGPVVAADPGTALALIRTVLREIGPRPACIDCFDHSPDFLRALENLGLSPQRPFIRMFRGPNRYPGIPSRQWAVCGPEIG
jgi:GNAT superfamily N-acetyltransferase